MYKNQGKSNIPYIFEKYLNHIIFITIKAMNTIIDIQAPAVSNHFLLLNL